MKKIYWFRLLSSLLLIALAGSIAYLLGGGIAFGSMLAPWIIHSFACASLVLFAFSLYFLWCTVVTSPQETKLKRACVWLSVFTLVLVCMYPLFYSRLDISIAAFAIACTLLALLLALTFLDFKLNRVSSYFLIPLTAFIIYIIYLTFSTIGI